MKMSTNTITANGKVPFGQKVAFGVGMLANQMFPAVLGIFMVVLVQDLKFPGWMWGVIYFFPRVFDSITDPIMGFISDNTRSKWGRRRQYVFLGAIIMGVAFIIMWQLYRESGIEYNFVYFLFWSFIFYLGLTIFSVPYVAMGYEMSNDFHERTNIMAVAQWIGQWAWVVAPWFWVVMYDPEWFPTAEVATRQLAIWVGIICMIFAMVPAIFIKSRSTLHENYSSLNIRAIGRSLKEILQGFKEAFQLASFRRLCVATFFIFNAFNTIAAFSFFIIVYYLFSGAADEAGVWPTLFGSLGALVTTFVVIPVVAWMSRVMGKKNAFILSQAISVIGYIMLWFLFVPGKPWMFIFALPFFSFGIGSLFTLMMSMTSDVIDQDELNTGKRREGIFGAIYWWMVKFGFAIAGGLSGIILSVVGFDAEIGQQTEETLIGLRAFYSGVPIGGTLIAILVMWNYDVSEEKAGEIRQELEMRKQGKKARSSGYASGQLAGFGKMALPPLSLPVVAGKDPKGLGELFTGQMKARLHGLCFSPYEEGQDTFDAITRKQVVRRMKIVGSHTRWVRSFACTHGNELIPEIAHQQGLKTMAGAWISDDRERNKEEIANLIKLAKAGFVNIAAIGNETLLRNELSEEEIIACIKWVKQEIGDIPVSYIDTYYEYSQRPALVDACDVVLVNCYPFWEGAHIDEALPALRKMHLIAKKAARGKQVIIAETGWPSKGNPVNSAKPSPENALRYFLEVQQWAKLEQVPMFYFSSFDESWKARVEGEVGIRWGLWNKDEKIKYGAGQSLTV